MEMVELEALNEDDVQILQQLISKHFNYTGSTVAQFLLSDLENQTKNFIKVFPTDYKRALSIKNQKYELSE